MTVSCRARSEIPEYRYNIIIRRRINILYYIVARTALQSKVSAAAANRISRRRRRRIVYCSNSNNNKVSTLNRRDGRAETTRVYREWLGETESKRKTPSVCVCVYKRRVYLLYNTRTCMCAYYVIITTTCSVRCVHMRVIMRRVRDV